MGCVDRRDWRAYNEALVRRGEIFLGLDAVEEWEEELEAMNEGKEGGQFHYPNGFVKLLGFIRLLFHLPYRQSEGFMRGLAQHIRGLLTPDYSTINRRVNRLHVEFEGLEDVEEDGPVTIAVDASGIKVANGGDWIRRVWKVRKGYLKIHIAVDVKSHQIVAMEVTSEEVGDNRMFKPLVEAVMEKSHVSRVLADGAYDGKENFNFLARHGVDPAIRVRGSSVAKSRGSMPRRRVVTEWLKDPKAWRDRHNYGYRWRAEGVFSCMKRSFGEHVTAKKYVNMVKEMLLKASLYNFLTQLAAHSHPANP